MRANLTKTEIAVLIGVTKGYAGQIFHNRDKKREYIPTDILTQKFATALQSLLLTKLLTLNRRLLWKLLFSVYLFLFVFFL